MLPNVLHDNGADHVPVLAEEVRLALAVRPGQTVIDVGASLGVFSLALAKCVGPAGRVVHRPPAGAGRRSCCCRRWPSWR